MGALPLSTIGFLAALVSIFTATFAAGQDPEPRKVEVNGPIRYAAPDDDPPDSTEWLREEATRQRVAASALPGIPMMQAFADLLPHARVEVRPSFYKYQSSYLWLRKEVTAKYEVHLAQRIRTSRWRQSAKGLGEPDLIIVRRIPGRSPVWLPLKPRAAWLALNAGGDLNAALAKPRDRSPELNLAMRKR